MSRKTYNVDLCVIGAGSAGLSVAAGAAQLGRSVVLYEAGKMGGDCLNYGCVPSKSLIAAARAAHAFRSGKKFGVQAADPVVDFEAVKAHIQGVIDGIAPHDSQERFEGLGCTVIREEARFSGPQTVVSESSEVTAKRIVIATGSRAAVPPIPGLDETPFLTNEGIFHVDQLPEHLIIIGAGPIGLELGQSFRRLGSQVSVIDMVDPLGGHDPEHGPALIAALEAEGVVFYTPRKTEQVTKTGGGVTVTLGSGETLSGSHLLVAAGRTPNIDRLDLGAADIEFDKHGITVDDTLRTTNRHVYAAGDVARGFGGLTHAAGFHGSALIKGFYFMPWPLNRFMAKVTTDQMPAAIYTAPELATIGQSAKSLEDKGEAFTTLSWSFEDNDRAKAERDTEGGARLYVHKGKILGASVLGEGAGDLIQIISAAMAGGVKISSLAQMISPYPTRGEVIKRAAGSMYTETVFGPKAKALAGFLTRFH